jgi:hypothetical protein
VVAEGVATALEQVAARAPHLPTRPEIALHTKAPHNIDLLWEMRRPLINHPGRARTVSRVARPSRTWICARQTRPQVTGPGGGKHAPSGGYSWGGNFLQRVEIYLDVPGQGSRDM